MAGRNERALPTRYRLQEFEIVRVLGEGGFGITYLGYDHSLEKQVAIKEYLPSDWAHREASGQIEANSAKVKDAFDWGKKSFIDEARTIAKLTHSNIVRAYRYFEANGTGYIVMDYVEGESLEAILKRRGRLPADQVRYVLELTLSGLNDVHALDILHRDIKPSNILVGSDKGQPVLIDFGAARQKVQTRSAPITAIVSPHYAPHEQYTTQAKNQGPWTDLYALSAVGYFALTGVVPPEGTSRFEHDALVPLDENGFGDPELCRAINAGLTVLTRDRPGSIGAWLAISGCRHIPPLQVDAGASGFWEDKTRLRGTAVRGDPSPFRGALRPRRQGGMPGWLKVGGPVAAVAAVAVAALLVFLPHLTHSDAEGGDVNQGVETRAAAGAKWAAGTVHADCIGCPDLMVVGAGSFTMGSDAQPNEAPSHKVTFKRPFAIGVAEITVGQWQACRLDGGKCFDLASLTTDERIDVSRVDDPVRLLTLEQIDVYFKWLSRKTGFVYRLPTEAEWEYAARGDSKTVYAWGDAPMVGKANCLNCNGARASTSVVSVRSYPPNSRGLYDMFGNVWEWVEDCGTENFISAPTNGSAVTKGDCSKRVLRGGGYKSDISQLRTTRRVQQLLIDPATGQDNVSGELGFRVVRELPQ